MPAEEEEGGASGRGPRPLPPLCLVSDADRVGEGRFLEALEGAVSGGLRMLQIREPGWDADRVRSLALRAGRILAAGSGGEPSFIIIGRRPVLAFSLPACGVHVGGGDPPRISLARAVVGPGRIVGYSSHTLEEIAEASRLGADYTFYSPVFPAISKTSSLEPLGLDGLERACRSSSIPVFALGGILPEHAAELRRRGAAGAAMIGGLQDAADPGSAARTFLEGWEAAARAP